MLLWKLVVEGAGRFVLLLVLGLLLLLLWLWLEEGRTVPGYGSDIKIIIINQSVK